MIGLGIDPGAKGAIACVCSRRGILEVANLPVVVLPVSRGRVSRRRIDAGALRALLQDWSRRHEFAADYVRGAVERMAPFGARDKVSATSLLSMGVSAGISEASLIPFCSEPPVLVGPQTWKRTFGLDSDKSGSLAAVQAIYPEAGFTRLRHDAAEAILLATWAIGQIPARAHELQGAEEASN